LRQKVWVWSGDPGHDWLRCAGPGWWTARPYEYRNGSRSLVWLLLGWVTSRRHLDLETARASRIVLLTGNQKPGFPTSKADRLGGKVRVRLCDCAIVRLCDCAIVRLSSESNLPTWAKTFAALSESSSQNNSFSPAPMVEGTTLHSFVPFRALRTEARITGRETGYQVS
jgi:hypothetical protein